MEWNFDIQVYVNDVLRADRQNTHRTAFTSGLGTPGAGDVAYLAVARDSTAWEDAFDVDLTWTGSTWEDPSYDWRERRKFRQG